MSKHTPTPWNKSDIEGLYKLVGFNNGDYILKCVNSHDALVKALKMCKNMISTSIVDPSNDRFLKRIKIIDKALELAGEKSK